jgi:hypothetical protein
LLFEDKGKIIIYKQCVPKSGMVWKHKIKSPHERKKIIELKVGTKNGNFMKVVCSSKFYLSGITYKCSLRNADVCQRNRFEETKWNFKKEINL